MRMLAVVLAVVLAAACGDAGPDEPGTSQPQVTGQHEGEVRACAVRCADGYTLTRQCTCEPAACTVAALCIQGYHWDQKHCSCVPDKVRPHASECQPDCQAGEYCAECRTLDGTNFFCLPDGAAC